MKQKTHPHSPEAALRLARRALVPSPHCRSRLDRGLAAAGVALPVAVSGAAVAHAAVAHAAASTNAATAASVSGAASVNAAAVASVAGSGVAPPLVHGSLVAALGAASTTTQALLGAVLLALGTTGVAVYVNVPSTQPVGTLPTVSISAPPSSAREARGRVGTLERAELLVLGAGTVEPGASVPASAAPHPATAARQAVPGQGRVPVPEAFTQNDAFARQAPPPVTTSDSASALIERELATVRETHAALARGDGAQAQYLLAQLDRTVPTGALQPERRVCAVLVACQLQQQRRALQLATELLASDGDFYRQRLAASCVSQLLDAEPAQRRAPTSLDSPTTNQK